MGRTGEPCCFGETTVAIQELSSGGPCSLEVLCQSELRLTSWSSAECDLSLSPPGSAKLQTYAVYYGNYAGATADSTRL